MVALAAKLNVNVCVATELTPPKFFMTGVKPAVGVLKFGVTLGGAMEPSLGAVMFATGAPVRKALGISIR